MITEKRIQEIYEMIKNKPFKGITEEHLNMEKEAKSEKPDKKIHMLEIKIKTKMNEVNVHK